MKLPQKKTPISNFGVEQSKGISALVKEMKTICTNADSRISVIGDLNGHYEVFIKNMIYNNITLSFLLSCVIQTHDLIIAYPTLVISYIYSDLYSIVSLSDFDHQTNMYGVLLKSLSFFMIYLIFILLIFYTNYLNILN